MITKSKLIDYLVTNWGFDANQLEKYSMQDLWDSMNTDQRKEYLKLNQELQTN